MSTKITIKNESEKGGHDVYVSIFNSPSPSEVSRAESVTRLAPGDKTETYLGENYSVGVSEGPVTPALAKEKPKVEEKTKKTAKAKA